MRDSGTIVALVGEGSDEQFAGYAHYHRYLRLQRGALARVPSAAAVVAARTRTGWRTRRCGGQRLPREIRELVRRAARDEPLFLSGAVARGRRDKRDLMSRANAAGGVGGRLERPARGGDGAATSRRRGRTPISWTALIYQEFQLRLPELLLMRVDKISMSTSIEARVPFLDHRLVEFTVHIPRP